VPCPENAELYKRYQALAARTPNAHFVGRLATYKYYNMDQVVAQALALYKTIAGARRAQHGGVNGVAAEDRAAGPVGGD
jgi:UDP-galactopyranose mutase